MKQPVITRGGSGESLNVTGGRVTFLCSAEATDHAWSAMEATLPRRAGPPPHHHPWDEAYYVVSGEVEFQLGDQHLIAKGRDFLYAPAGTPHAFQGASDEPARLLIFDAPAHAEAFFRDMDREVQEFPRDAYKIREIGLRHQLEFLM